MTETLLLVLKLSVVALIFAIGLGSTPADLAYLWRRPGQLARSLLAMYVAVPVAAVVAAKALPLSVTVKTAILALAISAGAPLLPRKLMRLGREGYVFSLVVTSSLLAVVAVPAWLQVIGTLFGREADLDPGAVAVVIAKAVLAPLVLGMLVPAPRPPAPRVTSASLSSRHRPCPGPGSPSWSSPTSSRRPSSRSPTCAGGRKSEP